MLERTRQHTIAMAEEKIAGLEVPARARFIRTIIAELERLHSHLLWAGIGAEDIGYHSMFMEIYFLRERVMVYWKPFQEIVLITV